MANTEKKARMSVEESKEWLRRETIRIEEELAPIDKMMFRRYCEEEDAWEKLAVEAEKRGYSALVTRASRRGCEIDEIAAAVQSDTLEQLVETNERRVAEQKEAWEKLVAEAEKQGYSRDVLVGVITQCDHDEDEIAAAVYAGTFGQLINS